MANQNIQISNRYNRPKGEGLSFDKSNPKAVSRTQQHFKNECNINSIMKKYEKTGFLTDPTKIPTRCPQFGDFSNIVDYQTLKNKQIEIDKYFSSLPAALRVHFNHNPQELMEWIIKPENKQKALEMGLLNHDLSNVKYVDDKGNDITDEVIKTRGLFINGHRVNKDGSPYVEPKPPVSGGQTS